MVDETEAHSKHAVELMKVLCCSLISLLGVVTDLHGSLVVGGHGVSKCLSWGFDDLRESQMRP